MSEEKNTIRFAIPVDENGQIWGHFGKTQRFKMYDIEEGSEDIAYGFVDTDGQGHGALADFLARWGVSYVICGGIGGGAVAGLQAYDIRVIPGVAGDPDQALLAFLNGTLDAADGPTCNCHHGEHDHEEGHSCGCHGDHDHEDGHGCGCH